MPEQNNIPESLTPFLPWDQPTANEKKPDTVAGFEFDSEIIVPVKTSAPSLPSMMDQTFVPGTLSAPVVGNTTTVQQNVEATFIGGLGATPPPGQDGATLVGIPAAGVSRTFQQPKPSTPQHEMTMVGGPPNPNGPSTLAASGLQVNYVDGKPVIPGYEILDELGRGGMGVVYKARQVQLNRLVALKMILNGEGASEESIARFRLEAEAIARVRHPGIVQVFDIAEFNGMPYFTLEFCDGGSLSKELREGGFAPKRCAEVVEQLARAMHFAHEAKIIHRDLKPANVLISSDGLYKITDFGLAKKTDVDENLTQTGAVMGTPGYMSPEQAGGNVSEMGPSCDIYSLGVILYECITGRTPFRAANVMDLLIQVVSEDPMPPSKLEPKTPRDLETICLKCLHKKPERRYATAGELAEDLARFVRGEPILGRPVSFRERSWKWVKKHPATTATVGMSILGFVLFVGFILWSNYEMGVAVAKARKEEAAAKDALQAQQQLFRDQQDARTALHEAKHAAEQKNWEQTVAAGRRAWEHTEKHGNHEEFVALATEAKQLIERGEERIRIGQNLQQFHELRDLVRTYGTPFSGLDLKSKIELSRKEIHRAIALFGLNPETKSTLNLQGGFTPEEKEEIAAGSFELLLILSDIEAQPLSGETREEHIDKARKALDLLNLAEKIHPTCVSFGMRKARLQKQFGDDSAAVRTLSEAIQKQPETAFDFFLLGEDRFHLGDLKTAQASLYEALQREPNHFWTQFYLSLCALQLNAPAEARTYLNSCLAQKPKFVGLYTLRGLAQTALKSYAHAAEDYQQALDLKPSETIRYGILVNRALMHFDLNETDAAVTDLNAAIRIKPDQYQAYVNLARVYERVDLPKAMNAIDSAIEREPRMGALYRLRAQYQVKLKNVPEAIKDYDLAIAKEPALSPNRIGDQLEKAKLLYRQKQYQEAVTICNEALTGENEATAKKSQRIRLHTLRSEALIELRRFAEAVESYDRAERLGWDPDAEGYRFRGLARGKMGRHSEAIADLSMSVEKNPLPEVFAERGWIYLVSSAPKLALWDFEESIRRKPSADAFSGRGFARVVLGQLPEAIADVKESLSQGSETPRLLFNASRITAQVGAKTPVPEKGKPGSATATEARQKLFDQSLEYLKKSLEALPSEKRASFWRDVVKPDEAMNPLRNQPGFAKLEQMYASPNTGR